MPITVTENDVIISGFTSFVGTADALVRVVYQSQGVRKCPSDLKEALGSPQIINYASKYGARKLIVEYEESWLGRVATDPPRHNGQKNQRISNTSTLMFNILNHAKSEGVQVQIVLH